MTPDLPLETVASRWHEDPDASVRSEAVRLYVARRGVDAFSDVVPLLAHPDTPEGAAAVRALGALGEPIVPRLAEQVKGGTIDDSRGALFALVEAGPAGQLVLRGIAADHPDAQIRGLARFLLGRPPERH